MSTSWLTRQRKAALIELSNEAGLPQDEDLRKDEIVENLNEHLQKNAAQLSRVAAFNDYFGKARATPGKPPRESTAAPVSSGDDIEIKSAVKKAGRRATKVKSEPEDEGILSSPIASATSVARNALATVSSALSPTALSPSGQLVTRTPAARVRRRSEIPGPASPADVADIVEEHSERVVSAFQDAYVNSGITEGIEHVRDQLSSVSAVQLTFLLVEAFALQRHTMPWKFAFDIPATVATPSFPVFLPDLFILLTGAYWSTAGLWSATSIIIPAVVGYFYNLTLRDVKRGTQHLTVARYTVDPLTFNVVKALLTWLVYSQGASFGLINQEVAERVDQAIYGGHTAVLIGSGIGILATLYEAAQKKHV